MKEHSGHFPPDHVHLALQPIIVPYQQETGRTLALLLAGVVLLLIIGCANCSILLLAPWPSASACARHPQCNGARRWRIVSQLRAVLAHWMQSAFASGSLFAAAALLALSALLACLLPARHAIAVPPAEALRYE